MSFDPSQFEQETISSAERLKLAREALARQHARDEAKKIEIASTQEAEAQAAAAEPQPAPEIIEPEKITTAQDIEAMFGDAPRERPRVTVSEVEPEILRIQREEQARLQAERTRKIQEEAQREADIRFAEEEATRKAAAEAAKPPEVFGPKPAVPLTTTFITPIVTKEPSIREQLKGTVTGALLAAGEEAGERFTVATKEPPKDIGEFFAAILEGTKAEVLPGIAGFVAAVESLGEFVGGRQVPDIGGAALGSIQESFEGTKIDLSKPSGLGIEVKFEPKATKEAEFISQNPLFLAGAVIGEVALGAVIGAVLGKVVKPIVKPIKRIIGKAKITPEEAALQTTKGVQEVTGFKPGEGVKQLTRQERIQLGLEEAPRITRKEARTLEDILRGKPDIDLEDVSKTVIPKEDLPKVTITKDPISDIDAAIRGPPPKPKPKVTPKKPVEPPLLEEVLEPKPKPLTRQDRIQIGLEEFPELTRKEANALVDTFTRKQKGVKPLTRQQRIQITKEKFPELTKREAEALADIFGGTRKKIKELTRQERIQIGKEDFPTLTPKEIKGLDEILGGKPKPKLKEGIIPKEELPKVTITKDPLSGVDEIIRGKPKGKPKVGAPTEFEKMLRGLPPGDEARGVFQIKFPKPPKGVKVKVGRQVTITKQVTKKVPKVKRPPTFDEVVTGAKPKKVPKVIPIPKQPDFIQDLTGVAPTKRKKKPPVTEPSFVDDIIVVPPPTKKKRKIREDVIIDPVAEVDLPPIFAPPGQRPTAPTKPAPPQLVPDIPTPTIPKQPPPPQIPIFDIPPPLKPKQPEPFPIFGPPPTKPKPPPLKPPQLIPDIPTPQIPKRPPPPTIELLKIPDPVIIIPKIPTPTIPKQPVPTKPVQDVPFRPVLITDIIQGKRGKGLPPFLRDRGKKRRLRERVRFGRKRFVNPLAEVEDVLGVGSRRVRKQSKSKKSLGNLNFF